MINRNKAQHVWMRNSAQTLLLEVPIDWRFAIGVTPQILSRDIVLHMGQWIQQRFGDDYSWREFLLQRIIRDNVWVPSKTAQMPPVSNFEVQNLKFKFFRHQRQNHDNPVSPRNSSANGLTWEEEEGWRCFI